MMTCLFFQWSDSVFISGLGGFESDAWRVCNICLVWNSTWRQELVLIATSSPPSRGQYLILIRAQIVSCTEFQSPRRMCQTPVWHTRLWISISVCCVNVASPLLHRNRVASSSVNYWRREAGGWMSKRKAGNRRERSVVKWRNTAIDFWKEFSFINDFTQHFLGCVRKWAFRVQRVWCETMSPSLVVLRSFYSMKMEGLC